MVEDFEPWLRSKLATLSQKTKLAEAIRYALSRRAGLTLFLDDGRVEIDNNTVERAIRLLALTRKNALFAGSDGGADHWAILALLIETAKLNDIDPQAYMTDVITRIVCGHPQSRIDELMPWFHRLGPLPWPEPSPAAECGSGERLLAGMGSKPDCAPLQPLPFDHSLGMVFSILQDWKTS